MSLLFFTGFNGITTGTITRRAAVAANASVGASGRYGQALRVQAGVAGYYFTPTWTELPEVVFGAWLNPVTLLVSDDAQYGRLMTAFDTNSFTDHLTLNYDFTDETISVVGPGPSYTEFFAGAASAWPVNTWAFLEVRLVVDNSAGEVIIRLNDQELYHGTGLDTRQGTHTPYGITTIGVGNFGMDDIYCDSIYALDPNSGSDNIDFLGPIRVDPLLTSANDAVQFTPSASTNESNIDDANSIDDDTTYNESSTLTHRDTFTVSGYIAPSHKVFGLALRAVAKASAADGRELRTVLDVGSIITGPSTPIDDTGYVEVVHLLDSDLSTYASPEDAQTAINGIKIGYEISA